MNVTRASDTPKTLSPLCFSQHHLHSLRKQDWLLPHMFLVLQFHHFVTRTDNLMKTRQGRHEPAWVTALLRTSFVGQGGTPSHSTHQVWQ